MNLRALLLVAVGLGLRSAAAAPDRPLARQSPFGALVPGGTPESPALELRGIMAAAQGTWYCIYDPASHAGVWTAAAETGNPFVVRSGDPALDAVTLEVDGRLVTLRLRDAKVIPALAEATPPPAVAPHAIMTRRLPGEPRAPREKSVP